MLVPLSWLKEYVDIDVTPEELEKKLFDGGFEVEERYQVGKDISNVVVGLVEGCEPMTPSLWRKKYFSEHLHSIFPVRLFIKLS